ncbi:MAG: CAT RNA binding domain-containing protein, partial [Novosphingobium sp.]
MRIIKVFNNNVALVRDENGDELVVQGRGIAFQARAGDRLDVTQIERRFMPEPTGTPEQLAQQVADIPPELLHLAERILSLGSDFDLALDTRATVALADHISIALSRVAAGQKLDNPLELEVRTLYESEFNLGRRAIEVIHEVSGVRLPESEAVSLALHFVNAQAGAQVTHVDASKKAIQWARDNQAAS